MDKNPFENFLQFRIPTLFFVTLISSFLVIMNVAAHKAGPEVFVSSLFVTVLLLVPFFCLAMSLEYCLRDYEKQD